MGIGTGVDWFPGGSGSGGSIEQIIEADGTEFQNDALKGKVLLTIARNNEILTEFSAYPDFDFDPVTGTVSGFPVSEGQRIIITLTNQ